MRSDTIIIFSKVLTQICAECTVDCTEDRRRKCIEAALRYSFRKTTTNDLSKILQTRNFLINQLH